jgi:site-specific DNA recombinase
MQSASYGLKDRLDIIDAELKDVKERLSKLYDTLETGKLGFNELAPRIIELRSHQDELSKARVQAEADQVAQGVDEVDISAVKNYAKDLRNVLEESDYIERKGFLRSFVKRVEVDKSEVTVRYKLPLPPDGRSEDRVSVLPIDTFGGPNKTFVKPGTFFEISIVPAPSFKRGQAHDHF